MYERFPLARFHPVSRWSRRERGKGKRTPSCGDGGNRTQRASGVRGSPVRSLMRGLTPQSRVHPSGAEAVKTLGGRERATLCFAGPGMKIAPLLSSSLPRSHSNANKYGTHKSVSLSVSDPKAEICQISYVFTSVMLAKYGADLLCYTCHK